MDRVRVGILGLRRGFTHLRSFLRLKEAVVVGACDRLPTYRERATQLVAEHGSKAAILSEYDDLLALKPDAVVVASNGKLQVEHACAALGAGCHVLSEVPGIYTLDEAVRLRDAVERSGRTYMLAENTCYWDFFRYWRRWVRDGLFGPISLAEGEYLHYLPNTLLRPGGETLTPTAAKDAGDRDVVPTWRADQPPIQYLTHDLGPLLEVLDDRCVSVSCRSGPWRSLEAPLRPDGQFALFETARGTLIRILVTLNTRRPEEHRYRLFGTLGAAEHFLYERFTRRFTKDAQTRDGWEIVPISLAAVGEDASSGHGGADAKVAAGFVKALLKGDPAPIDIYRAIEYALPGILADRSASLGGASVPIPDLRRRAFPGTGFWETLGLPESDPPSRLYNEAASSLRT